MAKKKQTKKGTQKRNQNEIDARFVYQKQLQRHDQGDTTQNRCTIHFTKKKKIEAHENGNAWCTSFIGVPVTETIQSRHSSACSTPYSEQGVWRQQPFFSRPPTQKTAYRQAVVFRLRASNRVHSSASIIGAGHLDVWHTIYSFKSFVWYDIYRVGCIDCFIVYMISYVHG